MAKIKLRSIQIDVPIIIASKIAELEILECTCAEEVNESEQAIICDKHKQIECWNTHCTCGVCRDCLKLLLQYHQSQPCVCTYKGVEVSIVNPDSGLEEIHTEQQVDIQCERCKEVDRITKRLSDYDLFEKAYIDEVDYYKYEVVDGVIKSKVVEPGEVGQVTAIENKVMGLDTLNAILLLDNANQQVKIAEHEATNAQVLLEIAMLKGGV